MANCNKKDYKKQATKIGHMGEAKYWSKLASVIMFPVVFYNFLLIDRLFSIVSASETICNIKNMDKSTSV